MKLIVVVHKQSLNKIHSDFYFCFVVMKLIVVVEENYSNFDSFFWSYEVDC